MQELKPYPKRESSLSIFIPGLDRFWRLKMVGVKHGQTKLLFFDVFHVPSAFKKQINNALYLKIVGPRCKVDRNIHICIIWVISKILSLDCWGMAWKNREASEHSGGLALTLPVRLPFTRSAKKGMNHHLFGGRITGVSMSNNLLKVNTALGFLTNF